ncbi:MAG: flippase-like domain-containing protein [Bacteroidales bacterium]|nr:flippase-like domain-containing protein [Bacteroidales bacterium]MCF8402499.1 flippase-like domain-containing protein [Bacteroidales bacterium]
MPEKEIHKKKKKIKWFTLLRLVGIVLFVFILFRVDLGEIWKEIRNASVMFLLLAVFFQLLLLFAKGLRWHLLNTDNQKQQIFQSLGEFFESYAMGVITPGRLGELMKAGYQNKREGIIASGIRVMAERGVDIGFFVFIAGISLYFSKTIPIKEEYELLIILAGVIFFILGVLLFSSKVINRLFDRFIRNYSEAFIQRKARDIIYIICLSLISNLFYFISCYIIGKGGIGLDITFIGISGGVAVAGLLNLLPITVMGLGTREVTFIYIFSAYPQNQVLALSALIFVVAQIGGGLIALVLGQIFLHISKRKSLTV